MAKFKVSWNGWAYVEADSAEEAREIYEEESVYEEQEITAVEEVDEFIVYL